MNNNACDSLGQQFQLQGDHTMESKERFIKYSLSFAIVIVVLNCLLAVIAVFCNGLVIATFAMYKQLHIPSNLLLACLAVSDFLIGSFVQPSFVYGLAEGLKGDKKCTIDARTVIEIISGINITVSLGTLFLITIDRYLAIEHALRYVVLVTYRKTMYAVIVTWVFAAGIAIFNRLGSSFTVLVLTFWWTYVIVICVIIIVVHLIIFFTSRKHSRRIYTQTKQLNIAAEKNSQMNSKSARTFAIVFLVSLICYLPFCVLRLIDTHFTHLVAGNVFLRDVMMRIVLTLMFANSSISPFLYFLRSKRLRFYSTSLLSKIVRYNPSKRRVTTDRSFVLNTVSINSIQKC